MRAAGFRKQLAVIGEAAEFPFPIHPHMCGMRATSLTMAGTEAVRLKRASSSIIPIAARTASSGRSKAAITASPMVLTIVPEHSRTIRFRISKCCRTRKRAFRSPTLS